MVQITLFDEQKKKKKKKFSTSSNTASEYYIKQNNSKNKTQDKNNKNNIINNNNCNDENNNNKIKNNDNNTSIKKEKSFTRRNRTLSKQIITVAGLSDSVTDLDEENNRRASFESQEMSLDKDVLREDLSKFTHRFLVYMILAVSDMVLGSLLFFYIEHCYDKQPPTYLPMEQNYITICNLFSSTHLYQDTNTTTSNITHNDSLVLDKIAKICGARASYEEKIECHLNKDTFSKWFEYTASIGFTVGMYIKCP